MSTVTHQMQVEHKNTWRNYSDVPTDLTCSATVPLFIYFYLSQTDVQAADKQAESKKDGILINVYDEEGAVIPYKIYG